MIKTKIAALAVLASLISTSVPAFAATVNSSATVKWNTQAVAVLLLHSNYSATGAQGLGAPTIGTNQNGGTVGACTATGAGSETAADVNFGNVTPDTTDTTNCDYNNAIVAQVETNSTDWTLTEVTTAALPAGYGLCALANNATKSFPFTAAQITNAPTMSQFSGVPPANATVGSCTTGTPLNTTAFTLTPAAGDTTAYTAASPAQIGEDIELQIGAAASEGNQTVTVTYTLTAN